MILIYNELVTATVLSLIVSIFVYFNTTISPSQKQSRNTLAIKAFIISFIITFTLAYFVGEDKNVDVVSHMIKGEPDF
jgi:uncharacterized PurR-regulated membrane protein YhhQ (DUF165 family)